MTIFNPSQQKRNIKFIVYLCAIIFIGGVFLVQEYTSLAGLRADERMLRGEIQDLTAKNGEIDHELSIATDLRVLENLAESSNLVSERTPQYLTVAR